MNVLNVFIIWRKRKGKENIRVDIMNKNFWSLYLKETEFKHKIQLKVIIIKLFFFTCPYLHEYHYSSRKRTRPWMDHVLTTITVIYMKSKIERWHLVAHEKSLHWLQHVIKSKIGIKLGWREKTYIDTLQKKTTMENEREHHLQHLCKAKWKWCQDTQNSRNNLATPHPPLPPTHTKIKELLSNYINIIG